MLKELYIRDFVIVEELRLEFAAGLTILTGETGAGKSIMVDALGLVLGDRADSGVVRAGCEQTEISARFIPSSAARAWLQAQGLERDGATCELRRVIARNGRSRAYINAKTVTVQLLSSLGEQLVDIHSQHAHQSLLRQEIQRQLLDAVLPESEPLVHVSEAWQAWKDSRDALRALGGQSEDREARMSLLRYQVEELAALELDQESLQQLEEEHRRLAHAGRLLTAAEQALALLDGEMGGVLSGLGQSSRELEAVSAHDERLQPILELLGNAQIQAEEAANELRHYQDHLEIDPARLDWLENRIADLQDIARKHQLRVEELPAHLLTLQSQLNDLEYHEQRAAALEKQLQTHLAAYHQAAQQLTAARSAQAEQLGAAISANMRQLGLPHGQLLIQVKAYPDGAPGPHGQDQVEFLVSTNPGQPPKPLSKVASGGELSRISLAIQVITAQSSGVGLLVFDEVDVGVGGGVAEIVGQRLAALGRQRQVLCITHLPQVAAHGAQHLQVRKHSADGQTQTEIHPLNTKQRVEEIARMLGGLEITAQTLAHAKEMLSHASGAV